MTGVCLRDQRSVTMHEVSIVRLVGLTDTVGTSGALGAVSAPAANAPGGGGLPVDVDNVSARCENGVLTIELPKLAEARSRKIEIGVSPEARQIRSGKGERTAA